MRAAESNLRFRTRIQTELGNIREKAKQEAQAEAQLPLREREQQITSMVQQLEDRDTKIAAALKAQADVVRKERELDDARRGNGTNDTE